MAEIKAQIEIFKNNNTLIYALAVDTPEQSRPLVEEMQLPFELLCDPERRVVKDWNLFNAFEAGGIAKTATFIIDFSGVIRFRALEKPHRRVNINDLTAFVEKLKSDPTLMNENKDLQWAGLNLKTMRQITRNMFLRGNFTHWKHYFMFPWENLRLKLNNTHNN